jgi:hypothetical protein
MPIMKKNDKKFAAGLTLVELIIAVVASIIVLFSVGMLLVSGHRGWNYAFNYANGPVQVNALETMLAFGSMGRRSNKSDYKLYQISGDTYTPAVPVGPDPEQVVFGEAVEFRYWDADLNDGFMDTDITGNTYMLFYFEDGKLMVDRGLYPPGGVDSSGNKLEGLSTRVLADNVEYVRFSHTTKNMAGDGKGCIKLDLRIYDEQEEQGITVRTATLMRNVWP